MVSMDSRSFEAGTTGALRSGELGASLVRIAVGLIGIWS